MSITKISPSVVDFDDGITITVDDNSDVLTLKSTDADENSGPRLALTRDSGSPADNDYIGLISFNADDDAGNVTRFGYMVGQIADASNTSEDGILQIHSTVGGTERNRINITSTETVFNEDSVDLDFRIESDANANRLFVDAGNDKVFFGTTASRNMSGVTPALFQEGTSYDLASLGLVANTNASNGAYLMIGSSRGTSNGSSTALQNGDQIGGIFFQAADGTDLQNAAAYIDAIIYGDVGNNDVPGALRFFTTPDGSSTPTEKMRVMPSGGITFNGDTSTANALDDYEEGNWTPVMQGSTTNGSPTMSAQNGSYTKVGRIVHLTFHLTVTNLGSAAGGIQISGIPFNTASNSNKHITTGSCMVDALDFHNSYSWIVPYASDGVSMITLYMSGDNIGWTPPDVDGSFGIIGSLSYIAA
jgi:hypothetical protein